MDPSQDLLEAIKMIWEDEYLEQNLDYEQIPFCCCRCHEYGHLFLECPLNHPKKKSRKDTAPMDSIFIKVVPCKRGNKKQYHQDSFKKMNNSNSFKLLGNHEEDSPVQSFQKDLPSISFGKLTVKRSSAQEQINDLAAGSILDNSGKDVEDMDILQQEEALDEIEDMDISELDLGRD